MKTDLLGNAAEGKPADPRIPRKPPAGFVVTSWGLRRSDHPDIAKEGLPAISQVFVATVYLKRDWIPSKSSTQGSYWLKHEVERHAFPVEDLYISNGALIQAALNLGIRVEPDRHGFEPINANVFVKRPPDFRGRRCETKGCMVL